MKSRVAMITVVMVMAALFLVTGAVAQTPASPVTAAPNIPLIEGKPTLTAERPALVLWIYEDGSFEVKNQKGDIVKPSEESEKFEKMIKANHGAIPIPKDDIVAEQIILRNATFWSGTSICVNTGSEVRCWP